MYVNPNQVQNGISRSVLCHSTSLVSSLNCDRFDLLHNTKSFYYRYQGRFCSRGGKHIVANLKGGQIQIQYSEGQLLTEGRGGGGETITLSS